MEDLSGQTLKGHKLLELIGVGTYSAVYRALQSTTNREVALKIIQPEVSNQPEFIRRFEIEAQMIARLEHLHIVPLYDFWRDPGGAYLVMRWLRGGSLGVALEKGPLDLHATVRLVDQIAAGLTTAHNNRIVHRGLKPSNILFDEEGNAYLSDFGIAIDLSEPVQSSRLEEAPVGSLDYLSPEQTRGQEITRRTDLYNLGVTLYETLTGQHPFQGISSVERMYKHINEPLPPIESLDPAIIEEINEVIQKATAKDPARRYKNALNMAAAFRQAARLDENWSDLLLEETLTQREQEILTHIVAGHSNKEIATALFIELPTVKWHITQLYRKMGVRSRAQASVRAREFNLIQIDHENAEREKSSTGNISETLTKPINPYKGLRPFKAADNRDFFGREALIEKLFERLGEGGGTTHFLAILGPSGSGKSSLLSAGLVPAIWAGKLPGSERWFVVEMTPGTRPLDELEVALTRIAAEQAVNLHAHLHRDTGGLHRAANLILPKDDSQLFLFIDQFEELFILTEEKAAREHFMDLIHHAVSDPRSRVRVVVAMRADFYDKPLLHHQFGQLLRSRMETLLPLSAEELERAIVQPARQVEVTFEPGLTSRIIEEMLYQPGALPLLQYALTELFESRDGRVLTQRAYEDIGGAVGALAQRADEVYLEFDHAGREAARQMFLRLINLGEGLPDGTYAPNTRRRIPQAELLTLVDDPELMEEVIDTFGAFRILSLDHDSASRQPILELAH
ncbi:MAG: protein kinase, partial [Anaerolineales bacterium]